MNRSNHFMNNSSVFGPTQEYHEYKLTTKNEDTNVTDTQITSNNFATEATDIKKTTYNNDTDLSNSRKLVDSNDMDATNSKKTANSIDMDLTNKTTNKNDTDAKNSRDTAKSYDTNATNSKDTTKSNDTDATHSKDTTKSNDTDAKNSKKTTKSNDTDATNSKETTKSNDTDAKNSKETAKSNDTDATNSKETAKSNDTDAKNSKDTAKSNDTDATNSKDTANSYDTSATNSKNTAYSYYTDATNSKRETTCNSNVTDATKSLDLDSRNWRIKPLVYFNAQYRMSRSIMFMSYPSLFSQSQQYRHGCKSNDKYAISSKDTAKSNDTEAKSSKNTDKSKNTVATNSKKTTKSNDTDATNSKETAKSNDTDAKNSKETAKSNDTDATNSKDTAKKSNDTDATSQRSPSEQMDMIKEVESAIEEFEVSQTVISTVVSEFFCNIIDNGTEEMFRNTDFSEITKMSFMISMQTLKDICLKRVIRFFFKWLATQLKCDDILGEQSKDIVDLCKFGPIIVEIIKKLRDGRLSLWEAAKQILIEAIFFGIKRYIAYQFGTTGYVFRIFNSVALNVIKHLIVRFLYTHQKLLEVKLNLNLTFINKTCFTYLEKIPSYFSRQ